MWNSQCFLVNRLQESCPNERSTFIQAPIILNFLLKSVLLVESIRIIQRIVSIRNKPIHFLKLSS
jgi:hypothetical protein